MSRTILVTGGCGFIGSNLIEHLLEAGLRPRVLDVRDSALSPAGSRLPAGVDVIVGDIRDHGVCRRAMAGVDGVVHLAAESGIPPSIEDPETNFSVNVAGTLALLLAAREHHVPRFVFASSGAVLGRHEPPADERIPAEPVSPYGASKLAGEAYCHAFGESYGISTVSLRFSNIYGPRSTHKRSVVAEFCKRALRGDCLPIFGDGRQTRDFLYVDDLSSAITAALDRPEARGAIQMGRGAGVAVHELATQIQALCRADGLRMPEIDAQPARPFEVRDSYYRVDRARRVLGFTPSVPLEEGVKRTWQWFRAHATGHETASGSSD